MTFITIAALYSIGLDMLEQTPIDNLILKFDTDSSSDQGPQVE
jgi:hypothetical protein